MDVKTLKIAFYVGELPAPTFINRLAEGLASNGTEITLFGLKKKPVKNSHGVRYSGSRDGRNEGRNGKFLRYLKYTLLLSLGNRTDKKKIDKWLRASGNTHWGRKALIYPIIYYKPHILHVQWAKAIDQFGWAKELDIKLVLSLRGAHINYSPVTIPGLAEVYQKLFPTIDGFHAVSKAIALEAAKYGAPWQKCQVVYSGFNLHRFPLKKSFEQFYTLPQRQLRVVSVGRSHWKKGYHHAMDAMHLLVKRRVDIHYTIIGASGTEELLFQQSQLGLMQRVLLLGAVPFEEVKKQISAADILLLPSIEEGIANVVLEAMLLGTLVVTTNCGGMEEVVEDGVTGFVVPVRNPTAIADALEKIKHLEPGALEAILYNARQKVEQQHSEEKMVDGMLQLYQTVLEA